LAQKEDIFSAEFFPAFWKSSAADCFIWFDLTISGARVPQLGSWIT
jgi:hypothetical protein